MQIFTHIAVDLCRNDFLVPYLERELEERLREPLTATQEGGSSLSPLSDDGRGSRNRDSEVTCAVRIASDAHQGAENPAFDDYCAERGLSIAVIACPAIIGTNMNGLPRRIAEGIYRGTFVHIKDNEARMSVIHATDVAKAVKRVAGRDGSYTLHDGCDPTIHDVAEALAFRLNEKRIITIKPRWARLWYGGTYFHTLTTDHLLSNSFLEAFPDFHPIDTLNYLRTHVYDESSL